MIVAVCSDKGAPGVTTLATVLGLVWPGDSTVLEADPSGSDLTFRLRSAQTPAQEFLHTDPSVFRLAADARTGLVGEQIARYAQATTIGVQAIPGPLMAEQSAALNPMWPLVATQAARSPDTVFTDMGRLQPGHPAWPMAQAATAVLVLAKPSAEGLYHLRGRVTQLAHALGDERRPRNPVAVVVLAGAKDHQRVQGQVAHVLQAAGSPIPVAGWMADDPSAVAALQAGEMTKPLRASALLRSVGELAGYLGRWWPQLLGPGSHESARPAMTAAVRDDQVRSGRPVGDRASGFGSRPGLRGLRPARPGGDPNS